MGSSLVEGRISGLTKTNSLINVEDKREMVVLVFQSYSAESEPFYLHHPPSTHSSGRESRGHAVHESHPVHMVACRLSNTKKEGIG